MSWLIIGSTAQYHWYDDSRQPSDLDLLTPAKIAGNESRVCVVDSQWHELAEEIMMRSEDKVFADPWILYTLKVSHAHWDIHFNKTLHDIKFLQGKGCPLDLELYQRLVKMWEKVHGEKRVNMNQSIDTFWQDAVVRVHDHEYVHECVKFYDRPLHERIRPNLNNTWCDEGMFNALSVEEQAQCVLEEMIVTAIERGRLTLASPKSEVMKATHRAHKLLCTSMAKGWFARYCILNHFDLLYVRKTQWLNQLTKALNKL